MDKSLSLARSSSILKSAFPRGSRFLAVAALVAFFACSAEAGRPVKWEYRVVNAGLANRLLENLLNANGAEGWELVQISAKGVAVFKRQKVK